MNVSFYSLVYKTKLNLHKLISSMLASHTCLRCGTEANFILCNNCLDVFNNPGFLLKRCVVCGKQLISEKETCLNCREEPLLLHTNSVYPIHSYRLWKKELLFQWKITGNRTFSFTAASLYNQVLSTKYPSVPIVPVPPRPGKIFSKGWDQINDIAILLKKLYGNTIISMLIRTEKKQQKKLNRDERIHQLGHLYEIKKNIANIPEEVVIIDDIMTTGVTLENCAEVLKRAGVKKVHAVTLFIAD